ncbi:MAG: hypothetical protein F9K16_07000 [Thermoanaerobaculia bacterium]|nr:MAG: hypothetical protein F9K16_07000 [Thermoanaerobaculia bacterium]MBZ0103616.1 hypothetical protein [Thermoanaerobaculia bacterium]
MKNALDKFYAFVQTPLRLRSRIVLALLVVPLLLAFTAPLWNISMTAPQYPQGLEIDIFAHKVEGGRDGADIQEINTLNHYIGMAPIDRAALSDLDWIPFAIGVLMILTLRVAAIGNVSALIDLAVMTFYFSLFSLGRFVYKLYVLGHNLDPRAPVTVEPFMPAVFGTKQIANFTVTSLPRLATIYMGIFATGVAALTIWHLWAGRRDARRAGR